jgi:hypothetical protein
MNIIEKFKTRTPRKNKRNGRLLTLVGTFAGALLTVGAVTNPIGIAALITLSIVGGAGAVYHGSKTEEIVEKK